MLPSSWTQLLLEHMDHQSSRAAPHPQSHHSEISPTDTPPIPHFTIPWKLNKLSKLQAAAQTFTHSDLHWVSIIRSLMVEMQDHPIETLHARPTPNLWRQEILGRITWRRCSSRLTSSVSSVSNIIVHFPFAFGYWKIMIIFPTSGTLRNILQNNSSKTFCKHNLLFSNITIMKWIHGIQCWKHLNPDLPHACVTESFGPQLQLVLHNCTWCCTPATDVHPTGWNL